MTAVLTLTAAIPAIAQEAMDLFRFDPLSYFTSGGTRTWIGETKFMTTNYADTVHAIRSSDGRGMSVIRTLVDLDDTVVVSRAIGEIHADPGDTTFSVRWKEARYPEATGRMRFVDDVWAVFFDGEWSKWSIHFQRQDHNAFMANVARSVGSFSPIPLAGMLYRAASNKGIPKQ